MSCRMDGKKLTTACFDVTVGRATSLIELSDTVPGNAMYIADDTTRGGQLQARLGVNSLAASDTDKEQPTAAHKLIKTLRHRASSLTPS